MRNRVARRACVPEGGRRVRGGKLCVAGRRSQRRRRRSPRTDANRRAPRGSLPAARTRLPHLDAVTLRPAETHKMYENCVLWFKNKKVVTDVSCFKYYHYMSLLMSILK